MEATGWVGDKEGNIEFVAKSETTNASDGLQKVSNCKGEIENI